MLHIIFKISILCLFSFLINCSTIDVSVSQNKDLVKKMKTIAIIPFDFKGSPSVGEEFSTSLSIYFIKNKRVEIIERNKAELEKILQEQKISRSGIIDEATAAKMGGILGVDVILIGFGEAKFMEGNTIIDSYRLKIVSVEKGSLILGVVKDPGIEWTPWLLAKYIFGLGLVWDKKDMLIESSTIKHIANETVKEILNALEKTESHQ